MAYKPGEQWAAIPDTAGVRAGSAVLKVGVGEELPWPLHVFQSNPLAAQTMLYPRCICKAAACQ